MRRDIGIIGEFDAFAVGLEVRPVGLKVVRKVELPTFSTIVAEEVEFRPLTAHFLGFPHQIRLPFHLLLRYKAGGGVGQKSSGGTLRRAHFRPISPSAASLSVSPGTFFSLGHVISL